MSHVKLAKVDLSYRGRSLFRDLSLQLPANQMTALVGPNGSGKSSLLRILAGLQTPDAGEVELMGRPLGSFTTANLAKVRAFMPQHTVTPEAMTVRQLVECGRFAYQGLFKSPSQEDDRAVDWAMSVCGVSDFQNSQLSSLSGGERQRAWLASALGQQAPILILDEPCSYLDISYQIELLRLLRDLVDNQGLTVIMSSHDIAQTSHYADHMVALRNGQLFANEAFESALTEDLITILFNVKTEFHTSIVTGKSHCIFHAM